jgi:5'-3' exonuclease
VVDVGVILAVDGNSLVHRSYHAAAGSASSMTEPIWAVRGLVTQIVAAVERVDADVVVVGFDDPDASIRRVRWPQYKEQRTDKAQCLIDQLALATRVLEQMGIKVVVPTGLEADDVLASTATFAKTIGARTVIMTSDRDSFALIDDTTNVLRIINGGVDASPLLTPARLPALLGITAGQYRDYAALRGDPSDNLPGVRGIGPKTAAKLLGALGSAQAAFDDLASGGKRVVEAIGKGAARRLEAEEAIVAWRLNCQVMAMHDDVELSLDCAAEAGPGLLPLATDAVRRAFDSLRLIYSLPSALRVLAGSTEAVPESQAWSRPQPEFRAEPEPEAEVESSSRGWAPRRRFPPLPARPAPSLQLSLFA